MNYRGFYTLLYKEVLRFYKVILQTVVAPVITTLLYLLVFSHALEKHVEVFEGVSYTTFLVPGLVMMTVIQNAFANSSSSLIQSKVTGNLVFILLTPLSHVEFYLAFVVAAVARGLVVGTGVYLVSGLFVPLPMYNLAVVLAFGVMGSAILGTLGIIAGMWAEKFDQLAGFQNFVIMPLSFLSGVFYSIHTLPGFWQGLSRFNPFFYMIDGFRYGFFGTSDINPMFSFAVVLVALIALSYITIVLLQRGYRLRD